VARAQGSGLLGEDGAQTGTARSHGIRRRRGMRRLDKDVFKDMFGDKGGERAQTATILAQRRVELVAVRDKNLDAEAKRRKW